MKMKLIILVLEQLGIHLILYITIAKVSRLWAHIQAFLIVHTCESRSVPTCIYGQKMGSWQHHLTFCSMIYVCRLVLELLTLFAYN